MKKSTTKIIGALFLIIGAVCVCYPIITSLWIEAMIGAGLLIGAVFALAEIPSEDGAWGKAYYLCLAILYAAGGAFMFANPAEATAAIMIALGVIFLMEGALVLIFWFKSPRGRSGVLLLNGIVTLVLGALILGDISAGIWFIGTLVGLDLIFTGITMFAAPAIDS